MQCWIKIFFSSEKIKLKNVNIKIKVKKVKKNIDIICSFWYDILTNRI